MGLKNRDAVLHKLNRGHRKSQEILSELTPDQWNQEVHHEPEIWLMKDLIAHFVSAEIHLLHLAQAALRGERGVPEDFDFEEFNHMEIARYKGTSPTELLNMLVEARQATIDWVRDLEDDQLESMGWHPVLGEVDVETIIVSIYAHQLIHMREVMPALV